MTKRLVIDANLIYAALLRDGSTRRNLMTSPATFHAPHFLRLEIEKHRSDIIRRSGATPDDMEKILRTLYRRINWVPDAQIKPHLPRAQKLLGHIDAKDVPYLACAFAVKADAIWSRDGHFDQQAAVDRTEDPT